MYTTRGLSIARYGQRETAQRARKVIVAQIREDILFGFLAKP